MPQQWSTNWLEPIVSSIDWGSPDGDRTVGFKCYMDGDKFVVTPISAEEMYEFEHLIFICCGDDVYGCGEVFNPHTSSFQKLVDAAKAAGWKLQWLDEGYETRCTGCNRK